MAFRLCAGRRLQLPACCWAWGRHIDSISQPAPGLGLDVPAPIRVGALRPDPIVSQSRGGSGWLLPGAPRLREPSALRRLPADLPTHLLSGPAAALGAPRPSPRSRDSLLPPSHRARAAAAAAGAAETITGGGSCGGAGNGPGGAGRRVLPGPFPGSALGLLWRSGQPRAALMKGSEMREAWSGAVGGRGARAPLGREKVGRGVGASGAEDAGRDCGGSSRETDGRLRSQQDCG